MHFNAMKLLLAFTIVIISYGIDIDFQAGPLANQESSNILNIGLSPSTINFLSSASRFRRNVIVDTFHDSIEKLEMISRLTNVIYLQQGLSNGSVFKPEELISELLHFGPVKPADIKALDVDKIKKALDGIKDLPKELHESKELDTVLTKIGGILEQMKGVKKAADWDDKDAYEAIMEDIKNGSVDLSAVTEMKTHSEDWIHSLKNIFRIGDKPIQIAHHIYLSDLKPAVQGLKNGSISFGKTSFKFTQKETAREVINEFLRVGASVNIVTGPGTIATSPQDLEPISKNAALIGKLVSQLSEVTPQLQTILDLHFSRSYPGISTSSEYVPGLPGGYYDVGQVSSAFKKEWIQDLTNQSSLDKSYPSVLSLGSGVTAVQVFLGTPDNKIFETIWNILADIQNLKKLDNFPVQKVKDITDCFQGLPGGSPNVGLIDGLKSSAEKVDSVLGRLNSAAETLKKEETNLGEIIRIIDEIDQANLDSIKKAFKELLDGGLLATVNASLSQIQFTGQENTELTTAAEESIELLGKVQNFQKEATPFYARINQLLNILDVPTVIAAVNKFKALKNRSFTNDGWRSVQNVAATKEGLTSIRYSIDGAKGSSSLESDLLNLLVRADVHSKILGLSTRGVVNMKTLMDQKSKFDVIKNNSKLIEEKMHKHIKDLSQNDTALLKGFTTFGASLDKMFDGLDIWKTAVNGLKLSNLTDLAEVIIKAKSVMGPTEDIGKMTVVVGKLILLVAEEDKKIRRRKRSTDGLKKVKEALLALDALQFTRYLTYSDKVNSSLSIMDSFFTEYAKAEVRKKTPTAEDPNDDGRWSGANRSSDSAPKEENETNWGMIVGIVVVVIVVLAVGCYFVWRRWFKNPKPIEVDPLEGYEQFVISPFLAVVFLRRMLGQLDTYAKAHPDELKKFITDKKDAEERAKKAKKDEPEDAPQDAPKQKKKQVDAANNLTAMKAVVDTKSKTKSVKSEVRPGAGGDVDRAGSVSILMDEEEMAEDLVDLEVVGEDQVDEAEPEGRLVSGGEKQEEEEDGSEVPTDSEEVDDPGDPEASTDPSERVLAGCCKSKAAPKAPDAPKEEEEEGEEEKGEEQPPAKKKLTPEEEKKQMEAYEAETEMRNKQWAELIEISRETIKYRQTPENYVFPPRLSKPVVKQDYANGLAPENPVQLAAIPPLPEEKTGEALAGELGIWSGFNFLSVDNDMNENQKEEVDELVRKKHREETREPIELNMENRITVPTKKTNFKTSYFHGNQAKYRNGKKIIPCQGPLMAGNSLGKKPNVEKFYYLTRVHEMGSSRTPSFKKFPRHLQLYRPCKENGEDKCCQYFPMKEGEVMKFKGFTVTCTGCVVLQSVVRRLLTVAFKDYEEYKLRHFHYLGWPDKEVPQNPAEFARIWEEIRVIPEPVVIHCSDGIGRTGTALLVEEIYQHIHYSDNTGIVDFGEALRNVRKYRARAVQTKKQFTFAIEVVLEMLFLTADHEETPSEPVAELTPTMTKVSYADYRNFLALREAWKGLRSAPEPVKALKEGDKKSVANVKLTESKSKTGSTTSQAKSGASKRV